jgi:hypothetical protein
MARKATIAAAVLLGVAAGFQAACSAEDKTATTFFVTSTGMGHGANLGSVENADAHCQALAEAAGAGSHTWRAYLSTQERVGVPAINARDRIGNGPWYNAEGVLIAENVEGLHGEGNNITKETALTEKGETVGGQGNPRSIRHEILTGSTPEGMAFTDGRDHTCNNWTSDADGNSPPRARFNTGPGAEIGKHDRSGPWNSHGISGGCTNEALARSHGAGLFYCFAAD